MSLPRHVFVLIDERLRLTVMSVKKLPGWAIGLGLVLSETRMEPNDDDPRPRTHYSLMLLLGPWEIELWLSFFEDEDGGLS